MSFALSFLLCPRISASLRLNHSVTVIFLVVLHLFPYLRFCLPSACSPVRSFALALSQLERRVTPSLSTDTDSLPTAWQTSAIQGDAYADRKDDGGRSPRRDRSRSPARNGDADRARDDHAPNTGSNLHVSGLARSVDNQALEDLFSKHGKVESSQVMFDPHTQESRGFGFVKMASTEEAEAAIAALNGMMVDGKSLTVAHARRGRARTPTPGRYHGVKVDIGGPRGSGGYPYQDRPYMPKSYDARYADRGPPPPRDPYERRYDDRRDYDRRDYSERRDYDRYDRRDYYDRRDRYDDYPPRGPPPVER